jgi:hypothetical protein
MYVCFLRITGSLDPVHRPVFYKLENTKFRKLDLFSSWGEWGRHLLSWVPYERANLKGARVGAFPHHLMMETDPLS